MHCNAIDTTGGQVCHWIDPTYINLQLMCLCHLFHKMHGDVHIHVHISNIWRIYFSKENMENHVVNTDLQEVKFLQCGNLWTRLSAKFCCFEENLNFFGGKGLLLILCSYHTTKVWYYDSRKQVILKILRVSYIQLYYHSQMLFTFFHEMWPDRDNHPNLHPTFFYLL